MKNKLILPVVGLMVSILGGCGQSAGEIAEIVSERDSLRNLSKRQERRLERLDDIVEIVNGSLDSIVTEDSKGKVKQRKELNDSCFVYALIQAGVDEDTLNKIRARIHTRKLGLANY